MHNLESRIHNDRTYYGRAGVSSCQGEILPGRRRDSASAPKAPRRKASARAATHGLRSRAGPAAMRLEEGGDPYRLAFGLLYLFTLLLYVSPE